VQAEYPVEKALGKEDLTVYLQASEWKTTRTHRSSLSVGERLRRYCCALLALLCEAPKTRKYENVKRNDKFMTKVRGRKKYIIK
jgi:hypothetical protein